MTDHDPGGHPDPDPGLCGMCRYSRLIETRTGSVFRLCERSVSDPAYPRYPALPVTRCAGFETVDLAKHAREER